MLLIDSKPAWVDCVRGDFDAFLADHAANERKASSMALSMVTHYPDRQVLTQAMIDLALEELNHFRQVYRIIKSRQGRLQADEKDPYVNLLRKHLRKPSEDYFLDRLLCAAVIEARGTERFERLGAALEDRKLAAFYTTLARSEAQHHQLFVRLANAYFEASEVDQRLKFWLEQEAMIVTELPIRARLH